MLIFNIFFLNISESPNKNRGKFNKIKDRQTQVITDKSIN